MKKKRVKKRSGKIFEVMKLDKHNLDRDSLLLPDLFDQACDDEAFFWSEWETLKTKRATLKSKVDLRLRSMNINSINKKYGTKLTKTTDKVFEHLVRLDPEVKKLANKMNRAFTDGKYASNRKEALREKRNSLDRLTSLHGQGYFKRKTFK